MDTKLPIKLDVQCDSVKQFLKGFRSEITQESYAKKLVQFLSWCKVTADDLLLMAQKNPKDVQRLIIDYIELRKGVVSGSTINQVIVSLKHFFEMNDTEMSWKKISKIMPKVRKTGSDRSPTIEEIRLMMESADTRTRCIILLCASSGIRVGAFNGMVWGDITPIPINDKTIASIRVYRGSAEEYTTFASSECYDTLQKYMTLRKEAGEKITPKSPLIRDAWDTHQYRKDIRKDPAIPTPLSSKTISNMMGKFLKKINMRNKDTLQKFGHEFKQIHGFRKYFKTNAERTMKTIDVEKLMGHAENYYKPSESYLVEQYAKTLPNLTISAEEELKHTLEKQTTISDKKIGEIERENIALEDRLVKVESQYSSLQELIKDVLIAKTKQ